MAAPLSIREIRPLLLSWYDAHRRELPWRAAPGDRQDPYLVWISEVMLQQTRVEAVRPYFQRWVERYPTLESLAAAPQQEVLKAWEGLGYYSRARNLHHAAREVAERYDGRVPADPSVFRALRGVGRYTCGAVLSIAFDREEPVVDGNVRRVFSRLTDEGEPRESTLWALAGELVPGKRPGDLNQALMELGATVCTPRAPRCGACPVRGHCRSFAAGTQAQRPVPKKQRALPLERTATAVVRRDGSVLLARRLETGRLGGLWEFPGVLREEDEDAAAAALRAALEGAGVEVVAERSLGTVDHVFTHVRVSYEAVLCAHATGDPRPLRYLEVRWVPLDDLNELALPRAQRRIAAILLAEG